MMKKICLVWWYGTCTGSRLCKIETFKHKTEPMVKKLFEENDIICGTETWHDRRDPDILSWECSLNIHI